MSENSLTNDLAPPLMTAEQAVKVLQDRANQAATACDRELGEVLAKHGFRLQGQPVFLADGRVGAEVKLVPVQ